MKTNFSFFLLLSILTGFLFAGCEPVDENTTGGDPRDIFIGEWQFIESSALKSTKAQSYIVTIVKDPDNSSQVLLKNFGNPGNENISVKGIATSKQIVVSSQNMSNGWTVEGSGEISNVIKTTMAWTYSIIAGGDKEYYTATATKQ